MTDFMRESQTVAPVSVTCADIYILTDAYLVFTWDGFAMQFAHFFLWANFEYKT